MRACQRTRCATDRWRRLSDIGFFDPAFTFLPAAHAWMAVVQTDRDSRAYTATPPPYPPPHPTPPQGGGPFLSQACQDGFSSVALSIPPGYLPVGFSFGCVSDATTRGIVASYSHPPSATFACPPGSVISGMYVAWTSWGCLNGVTFHCGPAFAAAPPPPPSPTPPPATSCPAPALPAGIPAAGLSQWYRAKSACGVAANFVRDLSGNGAHGVVLRGAAGLTTVTDPTGSFGIAAGALCPAGGVTYLSGQRSSAVAFGGSLPREFSFCVVARYTDTINRFRQAIVTSLNCTAGPEDCYILNHFYGTDGGGNVGLAHFGSRTGGA